MPFERLRVPGVVRPRSGVARVRDPGAAGVFPNEILVPLWLRGVENLADRARVLVCIEQLSSFRVVRAESGGQLAAVLQMQQHGGQKLGRIDRSLFRSGQGPAVNGFVEPVKRCDPALVVEILAHGILRV